MSDIKRENKAEKTTAGPKSGQPQQPAANEDDPRSKADAPPPPEPAQAIPDTETLPEEKIDLEAENAELKERLLRTMADMDNLRKRTEREKAETAKYAITQFANDILSIGDNIRRAIDAVPPEAVATDAALQSLLEGVMMTEKGLQSTFEQHGITRVDPKGQRFDPNVHQAMFELENADVPAGTIVEVVQAGYMISDRVLRPALVGIAKGGAKMPKSAPAGASEDAAAPQAGKSQPDVAARTEAKARPTEPPPPKRRTEPQPEPPADPPEPNRPSDTTRRKPGARVDRNA